MSTLYEIDQSMLLLVDPETGEISDFEAFESLQMERDEKIENVALWYFNLLSDAADYKAEEKRFEEKRKAAERKAEKLKHYLDMAQNGQKFKSVRVEITYRKSERIVFDDEEEFLQSAMRNPEMEEFITFQPPVLNKKAVKDRIKSGGEVVGAHLESFNNIQIK